MNTDVCILALGGTGSFRSAMFKNNIGHVADRQEPVPPMLLNNFL